MAGWLTKRLEEKQKAATVKAFEADGLQILPMEHKSEMQILREESEWLKMVLRDCENKRVNMQKKHIVDMTRPQPHMESMCLSALSWAAKLSEEKRKVGKEALKLAQITGMDSDEVKKTEVRLAMQLTKIITICTSWMYYGLGHDEEQRGKIQSRINEQNLRCGNRSIGDDEALTMRQEEEGASS